MKLLSITIENFLSIEHAHIDFDDSGMLLIEGWNYDVDRANGAGKTAILNAVSFALYDKLPRKITASEIVRRGSKQGSVVLRVFSGSEILVVRRSRPKGVAFAVERNGTLDSLNITQEEWEQKLRLSYNQFIVSMYCSQGGATGAPRFLLLNDADKKQFLLQLLNLDEFTACKKKVDEKIQSLLLKMQQLQNRSSEFQVKIDAYSESLLDEETTRKEISQKETAKQNFLKALENAQSVVKPDLTKYQKLEDDITAKKAMFAKLHAKRDMLDAQWKSLSKKIKPFNAMSTCVTCGTELDNSHAEDIHNKEMEALDADRLAVKKQMDDIDNLLPGEVKVMELATKLKQRKRQESEDYNKAELSRVELTSSINSIESRLGDLNKKLHENVKLQQRIAELSTTRDSLKTEIEALSKDLEVQKTVATIYSPTGAQAYILDSAVSLFNEHISKYIDILWANLTYELQSYKENVKGEVTAKFSESIIMDGKPISLGSLSGGELKALSICTDMALLGMLEQQFGIHMSPIIFDEAFDGLDTSGKEFALELIKGLAQDRQVIVIDHASEMRASFDKILRVEKRNGVSSVIMT